MFETSCNLVSILGKTEENMVQQWGPNCIGIAVRLYLQQQFQIKVQQISHQKSHVYERKGYKYMYIENFQLKLLLPLADKSYLQLFELP